MTGPGVQRTHRFSIRQQGVEVATLGPGDVFGEVGIVLDKQRNATVVSVSPLECLHFTREQLEQLEQLESEIPAFKEALETSTAARE